MHSAGDAAVTGRCKTPDSTVCGSLYKVRLHSVIGYVTPEDMLAGRQVEIHIERDRKLGTARQQRQSRRQQAARIAKWPAAAMSDSREVDKFRFAGQAS